MQQSIHGRSRLAGRLALWKGHWLLGQLFLCFLLRFDGDVADLSSMQADEIRSHRDDGRGGGRGSSAPLSVSPPAAPRPSPSPVSPQAQLRPPPDHLSVTTPLMGLYGTLGLPANRRRSARQCVASGIRKINSTCSYVESSMVEFALKRER